MLTTVSRGIRNCNPGNIRKGQAWKGLAATQTDDSFDQFVSPEYGIRAIEIILLAYQNRGLDSITKMISTWAPNNENDTQAYINVVANSSGLDPNACIDMKNPQTALKVIKAIIVHENGSNPYSDDLILGAITLALS